IMDIDGKTVTFAIPPGQLKFARRFDQTTASEDDQATTPPQSTIPESTANTVDGDIMMGEPLSAIESSQVASQPTSLPDRSKRLDQDENLGVGTATAEGEIKPAVVAQHDKQASTPTTGPEKDPEPNVPTAPATPNRTPVKSSIEKSSQKSSPLSEIEDTTPTTIDYSVVHFTISTLWPLEKKIIEIDGRLPSSTRTASAWRDIRCRRNEQDMGSLFEIRDEYYAYQVAGRDQNLRRGKKS
ncbi:MAG: hypothetical protein L6R42_010792, partial [Xanthoria sp. 1 TBL-2021]